eukprot:10857308-Heterocapsa_arctica.AAC.1
MVISFLAMVMALKGGDVGRNNVIGTLLWTGELVTVPEITLNQIIWAQRCTGKRPEQNKKQKCRRTTDGGLVHGE